MGTYGIRPQTQTQALRLLVLILHGSVLISALGPAPSRASGIELMTDNDFLTSNETGDDLYSFALELKVEARSYTFVLRENSFTDRQAGVRFDETYLTVGRHLVLGRWPAWSLRWEIGATHAGRGLLGQSAQNAVHRLIGDPELDLRYSGGSRLHPFLAAEAGRQVRLTSRVSAGPHVALETAAGFKSQAFLGLRALWRYGDGGNVRIGAGLKIAGTSHALLSAHLRDLAAAGEIAVDLPGGLVAIWSFNRYGTGRQHVSLGYRFASGRARQN